MSNTGADVPKRELYEKCHCGCMKHGGTFMHIIDCCNSDGYKPIELTVDDIIARSRYQDNRIKELEAKIKEQEHLIDVLNMEVDDLINSMNQ